MEINKKAIVNVPKDHPVFFWFILVVAEVLISEVISRFVIIPHTFYLFLSEHGMEEMESFKMLEEEALISIGIGVQVVALFVLFLISGIIVWCTNKKEQRKALETQVEGLTKRECELSEQLAEKQKQNEQLLREEAPYKEMRCLVKDLSEYMKLSDVVDSIQIFNCSSLPDPDHISSDNMVEIDFRFKDGTAATKANINVLYNICYLLPGNIYKSLMNLLKKRNEYFMQHKRGRNPKTERDIQSDAIELFGEISEILNGIEDPSQILDQHYTLYRILQILATLVIAKEKCVSCQQLLDYKDGVESQLKEGMRTGMLGALLLQRMYCFANENSVYKHNRSYFAAPLEYNSHKFIMLVVLQRNKLRMDSEEDESHYCKEVYDEIERLLLNNAERRGELCPTH